MREMSFNERKIFIKYLDKIRSTAIFIKENLVNKVILYESENISFRLTFFENNFMHLLGLNYEYGPSVFFNASYDNSIDLNKVKIKKDNTTFLKIQIIDSIKDILDIDKIYITPSGISGNVKYDNGIRTKKMIMFLMVKKIKGGNAPFSLINLRTYKQNIQLEKIKSITIFDYNI